MPSYRKDLTCLIFGRREGPVQANKQPSNYKFTRPNDGWTGLYMKPYPVLAVSLVRAVEITHGEVVILVQPLHHKRLKPPANENRTCQGWKTQDRYIRGRLVSLQSQNKRIVNVQVGRWWSDFYQCFIFIFLHELYLQHTSFTHLLLMVQTQAHLHSTTILGGPGSPKRDVL